MIKCNDKECKFRDSEAPENCSRFTTSILECTAIQTHIKANRHDSGTVQKGDGPHLRMREATIEYLNNKRNEILENKEKHNAWNDYIRGLLEQIEWTLIRLDLR